MQLILPQSTTTRRRTFIYLPGEGGGRARRRARHPDRFISALYHGIRMDKIIPVRVPEPVAGEIDRLVRAHVFRSRNDGIREGVRMLLARYRRGHPDRRVVARLVANHVQGTWSNDVAAVVLFGSVASGTDTDDSDIDMLVLTRGSFGHERERRVTTAVVELLKGVDEIVSLHFTTVGSFRAAVGAGHAFETGICSHGILLAGTLPAGCPGAGAP